MHKISHGVKIKTFGFYLIQCFTEIFMLLNRLNLLYNHKEKNQYFKLEN